MFFAFGLPNFILPYNHRHKAASRDRQELAVMQS